MSALYRFLTVNTSYKKHSISFKRAGPKGLSIKVPVFRPYNGCESSKKILIRTGNSSTS